MNSIAFVFFLNYNNIGDNMNNKGFTLVELLATISILAIISIIAIPNVISMMEKNKKEAYISDAKKFYTLVEYEKRKDSSLTDPIQFSQVDTSDIDKSPSDKNYVGGYVNDSNICLTDGEYVVSGSLNDLNGDNRLEKVNKGSTC